MSPEIRARSEGTGAGLADRPDTRQPAGSRRFTGPPVTRFDRLARSTCDLLNTLAAITGKDYAEEALSVVHSLNLRSALGIFF
jgi:hypothetical protein